MKRALCRVKRLAFDTAYTRQTHTYMCVCVCLACGACCINMHTCMCVVDVCMLCRKTVFWHNKHTSNTHTYTCVCYHKVHMCSTHLARASCVKRYMSKDCLLTQHRALLTQHRALLTQHRALLSQHRALLTQNSECHSNT